MPAKPTVPAAGYSFTSHTANNPTDPQPGSSLDSELEQLRTTEQEIIDWSATTLADDGTLRNAVVDPEHLSAAALAYVQSGWTPRGTWLTATAYAVGDYVRNATDDNGYVCIEDHTSGTFATDLAANKWIQVNVAAAISGHTIKSDGTPMTVREGLNFDTAFTLADDAGSDETDVTLNFGTGAGQPAEGNHNHSALYAALSHEHRPGIITNAGNYSVSVSDFGKTIRITGGGTVSFAAAATLATGFYCTIIAVSGPVTLDPTETIDGAASVTLTTGSSAMVFCDGSYFYTARGTDFTGSVYGWEPIEYADLVTGGPFASVDLTHEMQDGYIYRLVITKWSSTATFVPAIQLRNLAGTWRTTLGDYHVGGVLTSAAGVSNESRGGFIPYNFSGFVGVNPSGRLNVTCDIFNPRDTVEYTSFGATTQYVGAAGSAACLASGTLDIALEAHDKIRIVVSGGTMDAGEAYLFRMKEIL